MALIGRNTALDCLSARSIDALYAYYTAEMGRAVNTSYGCEAERRGVRSGCVVGRIRALDYLRASWHARSTTDRLRGRARGGGPGLRKEALHCL